MGDETGEGREDEEEVKGEADVEAREVEVMEGEDEKEEEGEAEVAWRNDFIIKINDYSIDKRGFKEGGRKNVLVAICNIIVLIL